MRSLIARISGGLDLDVVDLSLSFVLDEVGEFDVTVPARSLNYRTVRGSEISIISNGNVLVSGFVEKSPDLPIKRGETLLVKLSCLSELGRLTCYKALADSHFQDTQVAVILATLLATVPDWTLQTVNMPDPTITTTIDLRGCETLFCQIVQTVQSVPELHLRFGGFSSGIYTLAVGAFNNLLHSATQDHNLVDLTLQANSQRCYNIVESYGALSRTQNVTLADSLADARTIASPYYTRYPIILLPDGSFGVEDTLATCECAVRKSFSLTKTENDADPTPAEIAEAGYALYLKTVRYLQSREDYDSFRGTVIYETPPNIGDRCHLKANVLEPIWDEHNQCITYHPTFSVNTDYRVTKLTFAFERGVIPDIGSCNLTEEQFVWDIELTSSDEAESFDPDIDIYERLRKTDQFDAPGLISATVVNNVMLTFDESVDASDCVDGVQLGKEFIVTDPSVPINAVSVTTLFSIDNPIFHATSIVTPVLVGDDWEACVTYSNGVTDWGIGANVVTVTVTFIYQVTV